LRDVEAGTPVGPDTLFPICSVTKSFTATGLALLVDEGKLEWDAPVREMLPEFRLRDPVASTSLRKLTCGTPPLFVVHAQAGTQSLPLA
jgi:CubicO group peptidase (beta-lactamase class C family)